MALPVVSLLAGTALGLLSQLAGVLLGPFGFILGLVTPLPVAFVGFRQGAAVAAGIVLATAASLFFISGPVGTLSYILQYGLPAWLLALLLRRGWGWDRAVVRTLLIFAAMAGGTLLAFAGFQGKGVGETVSQYMQTEVERAMAFWSAADLPPDQLQELRQVSEQMAAFLIEAWPGLALTAAGLLLLFIVLVLSILAKGHFRIEGPPFPQWKAPEMLIWVLIAAGVGMLFTAGTPRLVALNLLVVVLPIYFLQGLAIVSYWFRQKSVSPLFRRLGYLFIVIVNPLPVVVTGLGVFDMWVDFRKPRVKNNQ